MRGWERERAIEDGDHDYEGDQTGNPGCGILDLQVLWVRSIEQRARQVA